MGEFEVAFERGFVACRVSVLFCVNSDFIWGSPPKDSQTLWERPSQQQRKKTAAAFVSVGPPSQPLNTVQHGH